MKTVMVAHRGAQKVARENTLTAFKLAVQSGFKAIECDVQLTSDGELIVIHDETVDRTTNGTDWVSKLSYSHIQKLRIEGREHIPTLDETIYEVVISAKRKLIVEIKADTELHSRKVAAVLAEYLNTIPARHHKYIEVHSFWYEALKLFNATCKTITTAAIINGGFTSNQIIKIAEETGAKGVSLGYEFISARVVKDCHSQNLFVDIWAISDGTVLKRLRPFGIDAMVENFTGTVL